MFLPFLIRKRLEHLAYARACYRPGMGVERHVRLFRNGRNQAVRIPREFELPGNEATIRKEDGRLIIEPTRKKSVQRLIALLQSWEPLPEDEQFPEIEDLPPEPFDLDDQ